jgi:hypothetical protein
LRVRRFHRLADGLPNLLKLAPEQGAELVILLVRIARCMIRRALERDRRTRDGRGSPSGSSRKRGRTASASFTVRGG